MKKMWEENGKKVLFIKSLKSEEKKEKEVEKSTEKNKLAQEYWQNHQGHEDDRGHASHQGAGEF